MATPSEPLPVIRRVLRQARAMLVRHVSIGHVALVSCGFVAILALLWTAYVLGPARDLEQLYQQLSDEQLQNAQKIGELTSEREDQRRKNVELQEELNRALSKTDNQYKTCRNAKFGQVGWNREETISRSSGWMSGGKSQSDWCNSVIEDALRTRSIGPEHATKVVQSNEQGRWVGIRHREYNYSCTVLLQWDPLYAENADPLCGRKR